MVARLRTDGMSTRQIAEVAQVPKSTVDRDLPAVRPVPSGTRHTEPVAITGQDGKTYQPQTLQQRRDLAAQLRKEGFSISQIVDHMNGAPFRPPRHLLAALLTDGDIVAGVRSGKLLTIEQATAPPSRSFDGAV